MRRSPSAENLKKSLYFILAGALILVALAPNFAQEEKPAALVVKVDGKPALLRNGEMTMVLNKMVLKANDKVQVRKGDSLTLMLGSGITCRIGSDSSMSEILIGDLTRSGNTNHASVQVNRGSLGAYVHPDTNNKQDFTIKTPTAVASVRGTSFLVDADEKETELLVDEGGVEFASATKTGDRALVEAGSKAVSGVGGVKVSLLLAYEKARLQVLDTLDEFDTDYYEDSIGDAINDVGDAIDEKWQDIKNIDL